MAVFAKMNLATMRVLEFYAKVPYWLVIITQHGLAGRLVYELPCEARFCTTSRAKRPKQQTSQPRSLLVITMLHCKTRPSARFWSGQGFGIATGGGQAMPPARYALTPLYGGRGGWGHCVLKHTAGPLSDKGGGVQCRLPRIILTNKLDTNTCQNKVRHFGAHSKKQRSCIDAIRNWMRL